MFTAWRPWSYVNIELMFEGWLAVQIQTLEQDLEPAHPLLEPTRRSVD
jgi:hypothetical protein